MTGRVLGKQVKRAEREAALVAFQKRKERLAKSVKATKEVANTVKLVMTVKEARMAKVAKEAAKRAEAERLAKEAARHAAVAKAAKRAEAAKVAKEALAKDEVSVLVEMHGGEIRGICQALGISFELFNKSEELMTPCFASIEFEKASILASFGLY